MTTEPSTRAPIPYQLEGDIYLCNSFTWWLEAMKRQVVTCLKARQAANHTAMATVHESTLWLTAKAYIEAVREIQSSRKGCPYNDAAPLLLPSVLNTLAEFPRSVGVDITAAKLQVERYTNLAAKDSQKQKLCYVGSFTLPEGTPNLCRRLVFTIVPYQPFRLVTSPPEAPRPPAA